MTMIWAVCRGKRIQKSEHSDFGILGYLEASTIFTCVYADTASAACPSRLAMTSVTFAAVICDADEPSRLLQCALGARLVLQTSEIWVLTPHSKDDRCPPM